MIGNSLDEGDRGYPSFSSPDSDYRLNSGRTRGRLPRALG